MANQKRDEQVRLGFLVAIEVEKHGFVGGLLVTNHQGRPLEFQCTTPVRPNRTQEILYGSTLKPFLLGELIGSTLVERVTIKPDLVLVAQVEMLELRNHVDVPVALCATEGETSKGETSAPGDTDLTRNAGQSVMRLGRQTLRFHTEHASADGGVVRRHSATVPADADLNEPFERVRDALSETLRTVTSR